jgi:epoxyqueuosine reductase
MNLAERIISRATELGFDLVGIAPAGMALHAKEYADWVTSGFAGEMAYMTRNPDRRSDLRRVLPDAKSVIVVGLSYYTLDLPDDIKHDPSRGLIARYAWGIDYHDVLTPHLKQLARFVEDESRGTGVPMPVPTPPTTVYVDTGPVLERDWALAAGLGFIGKNTCLINPRMGSWLFLGVIITDVSLGLDPSSLGPSTAPSDAVIPGPAGATNLSADGVHYWFDTEIPRRVAPRNDTSYVGCGTCTRCLTTCPTNAFPGPYVLDARKCISYLTIELKGSIPMDLRPLMGNHIFGCDICQEVCPWPTRFAKPTKERSFYPAQWPVAIDLDRAAPKLIDLALLNEEDFQRRFVGTPILRAKRRGLLRNVAVALGNWGSDEARETLKVLARDPDPLVAEHARWGLTR